MENGDNKLQELLEHRAKSDAMLEKYRRTIDELLDHVQALASRLEALELRSGLASAQGLQVAKVVGAGEAGTPAAIDAQGRVTIQMNWNNNPQLKAVISNDWLTASGGGSQFLPRVGQNVFVAFQEENAELPVVVGYLASSENPLPYPPGDLSSPEPGDTVNSSPTLAAVQKVDSDFPKKANFTDYNPSTDNLAKGVLRSANYGTTASKASEIAFVDELNEEALTVATQGELRQYSKGDHYFRSEGNSINVIDGEYDLAAKKDVYLHIANDYTEHYGGEHKVQANGHWYEWRLQNTQRFLYGDFISVFGGGMEEVFLGQRTDITINIFPPYFEIVLGSKIDIQFAMAVEWFIGPVRQYATNSTLYCVGDRNVVVVGANNRNVVGIQVEKALRHDEREVRRDEGDVQDPALVPAGRVPQVVDGLSFSKVVDLDLFSPAWTGRVETRPGFLRGRCALRPVENVVRPLGMQVPGKLGSESVAPVRPAEVLFTGEDRVISRVAQEVGPGDGVRGKRRGVVPGPDVADVASRHERHAGGHAERRIAVGVLEGDPFSSEPVHVRGPDEGMAVRPAEHGRVLVGHDEQDVRTIGVLRRRCGPSGHLRFCR